MQNKFKIENVCIEIHRLPLSVLFSHVNKPRYKFDVKLSKARAQQSHVGAGQESVMRTVEWV